MLTIQLPSTNRLTILTTISRIELVVPKEIKLDFKWAGAFKEAKKRTTSKELEKAILQDWLETD